MIMGFKSVALVESSFGIAKVVLLVLKITQANKKVKLLAQSPYISRTFTLTAFSIENETNLTKVTKFQDSVTRSSKLTIYNRFVKSLIAQLGIFEARKRFSFVKIC